MEIKKRWKLSQLCLPNERKIYKEITIKLDTISDTHKSSLANFKNMLKRLEATNVGRLTKNSTSLTSNGVEAKIIFKEERSFIKPFIPLRLKITSHCFLMNDEEFLQIAKAAIGKSKMARIEFYLSKVYAEEGIFHTEITTSPFGFYCNYRPYA